VKGRTEIPGIVEDYLNGKLSVLLFFLSLSHLPLGANQLTVPFRSTSPRSWVDEFISHERKFAEINKGFDDMHAGSCIRCVVDMA
jgi:S-(hydroxymethyl)glutathione dehydrogenase/alcohol dehydrogenase